MPISKRKLHIEPEPDEKRVQLRVAFATQDRQDVNQHFGSAASMMIYGISPDGWHLLEVIEYVTAGKPRDKAEEHDATQVHDRLPDRIRDLQSCAAVYCNACGASAIHQLLEYQIQPVKVVAGSNIHTLLSQILYELNHTPAGWLARSLKRRKSPDNSADSLQRLSQLIDEDWSSTQGITQ
ncbi:NifB/NifX family molybdenum-iron cluster-binding protein [Vibrio mangrovi]|uniref:Dinitrogenase iron-molybdenum cofactor n=1 Tax=Vibrio mangrovi TaxID=474394 RepID=A0A1Y6INF5_9VIBR|nr:NifB/NifX family molybdenum-iron cluster-binding protein [Vibrio mangrovi]MDW6004008.1 NifB/NifX family molybdenum-iron cluster-binding protein [Vibrio mangrovi]SMR99195.1 Dinitrogenase iron-molybdenum cofactor [Vibrio mangrovi]